MRRPRVEPAPSHSTGRLPKLPEKLRELTQPHIESFDYFLDEALPTAVADIPGQELTLGDAHGTKLAWWVESIEVGLPTKNDGSSSKQLCPRECRERGLVYGAPMVGTFRFSVDDGTPFKVQRPLGNLPIMVLSGKCRLKGKSVDELVSLKEEASEFGGYFIVNGIERVVRILQVPRRDYAVAVQRSAFKNRGPQYSDKAVTMRCARADQSTQTVGLHYLNNGSATLRFSIRKQEFLVPLMVLVRALGEGVSDLEVYERLLQGDSDNMFLSARLELLLHDAVRWGAVRTRGEALVFLGKRFRTVMGLPDRWGDAQCGAALLRRHVLVHCDSEEDKLECLLHMARKLYAFVQERCCADNADALSSHELLLPGHLMSMFVKEKVDEGLQAVKLQLMRDARVKGAPRVLSELRGTAYMGKVLDRCVGGVGAKVVSLLSTGNVISSSGLDLMQVSGFTVVAERLNALRYMSHFRAVHRGQFFTTMKTTAVRKLLPESWGFLCPVHTPDGGPCGLLQHLALKCLAVCRPAEDPDPRGLKHVLCALGVTPAGLGGGDGKALLPFTCLPVLLDGVVVGGAPASRCAQVARALRVLKGKATSKAKRVLQGGAEPGQSQGKEGGDEGGDEEEDDDALLVDPSLEVAWLPPAPPGSVGTYPGLYLFTRAARMVRPVLNLATKQVELIGPLEQVFLEVACLPEDVRVAKDKDGGHPSTHLELDPTNMLSLIAALTPFSDYNQGPRIMYQCQMGKQTMGTPAHSMDQHPENKAYKIQSPQAPLVQTRRHAEFQMDEYPQGTNAVVAVISYTGYDMEDAMILNKSSYERGFAHASVYKTKIVDLAEERKRSAAPGSGAGAELRFGNAVRRSKLVTGAGQGVRAGAEEEAAAAGGGGGDDGEEDEQDPLVKVYEGLDEDGLPAVGLVLREGDPLACTVDSTTGVAAATKHKDAELAFVQTVRAMGTADGGGGGGAKKDGPLSRAAITLRYPRNPIIGDKFSSRHGQKGVMSILWPQADMPFTESGLVPDVIINPHAFPSRMTMGMLLESMAGKAGSLHGTFQDATPFSFNEEHTAVDHFGEQLAAQGYSYYGSEPLYSGVSGKVMHADIFIGVVYYQRLRHMVSDKSQARAVGPVNALTRQPIKGRKKHGGIRLGEMERDALIAHGSSALIMDRLFNCSDKHIAYVCTNPKCGSLLAPTHTFARGVGKDRNGQSGASGGGGPALANDGFVCRVCNSGGAEGRETGRGSTCEPVALPYVFRYLTNELAGMNIRMTLQLDDWRP